MRYLPYHKIRDHDKVDALVTSMDEAGWQGPPIVVDGHQAITGTHRLAAWLQLHGHHRDVPAVQIADLFTVADMDYEAVMRDMDYQLADAIEYLPEDSREAYGIDVH